MKNSTMLRLQLGEALEWLDNVVRDLSAEQYSWQPEGSANPISKLHAHTLTSADFWMNLMGLGKPMLWRRAQARAAVEHDRDLEDGRADQPERHAGVFAKPAGGRATGRGSARRRGPA